MRTSRRFLLLAGLTGLVLLGLHVTRANSEEQGQRQQQPPQKPPVPRLDVGKTLRIEPKLTNVVKNSTAPAPPVPPVAVNPMAPQPPNGIRVVVPRLDVGKGGFIEPRLQFAVQNAFAGNLGTPNGQFGQPPAPPPPRTDFVNPKVEPGKVKWHKTLDEARAASVKSKKPVLVFQMMGKLDDQFC